jgi:CheY-like chemotaxis protein
MHRSEDLGLGELSDRKFGYVPIMASDGVEAMHILEGADYPRLAILDWVMPGMDGIDVCDKRALKKMSKKRIIVCNQNDPRGAFMSGDWQFSVI